jgi:serine/threonine-protein kinase
MDFGIAAAGEGAQQAGERVGTPYYMSPEQAQGKPVDGRSDLYALGVVLYRLVSATLPFDSGDILAAHVSASVPPLSSRVPGLPPALEALVMGLLAKDPAQRPASAAAVRARLAEVARAA